MKRRSYRDPLPVGPPHRQKRPTAQDFFVEWNEDLTSAWNRAALSVITHHVIQSNPDDIRPDESERVARAVRTHLRVLHLEYHAKPTSERREHARRYRVRKRKREVRPEQSCDRLHHWWF